jgi:hypothetical protein
VQCEYEVRGKNHLLTTVFGEILDSLERKIQTENMCHVGRFVELGDAVFSQDAPPNVR